MSETRQHPFAGDDPIALAKAWLVEAERTETNDPNAIALATVDDDGMPNARIVLLKSISDAGFTFYTNYGSSKAQELDGAGKAAFVMHWKSLRRQIRARGRISRVGGEEADAYYRSRSLGSRLGAWASRQSEPLETRAILEERVAEATSQHGDDPDRPPFWGGFLLMPLEIEFWADGAFRLHDRFRWTREQEGAPWAVTRLNP